MNKNNYQSLLVIVVGFMVMGLIFKSAATELNLIALVIGVGSLMFSFFRQAVLWTWGKIAEVLGWFNSRVLLSVIFYAFLTPMAILKRIFTGVSKSFKSKKAESYYFERTHQYQKEDIENPW